MVFLGHLLCTPLLVTYVAGVEDDPMDASSVLLLQNQVNVKAHKNSNHDGTTTGTTTSGLWSYDGTTTGTMTGTTTSGPTTGPWSNHATGTTTSGPWSNDGTTTGTTTGPTNQVNLKAHMNSNHDDSWGTTGTTTSWDWSLVQENSGSNCWDYTKQYDELDTLLGGNEDVGGDRCDWYLTKKDECGSHDDDDFLANEMCCSCGGGSTGKGSRTLAVNGASVFLSEGEDCPVGFEPITSITACRAALDMVGIDGYGNYKKTETVSDWPKGCYYCTNDTPNCEQGVFFNRHASGATVTGTHRFCHKNYDAKDVDILFVGDSDIDYWDSSVVFPGSFNVGIGGYETSNVFTEMGDWAAGTNPKWVVLVIGENDIDGSRAPTDAAIDRFKKIASTFINDGARVIYLGTKVEPDNTNYYTEYMYYDAAIRKFATEQSKDKAEPPFQMIDVFRSFTYKQTAGRPKTGKDATWAQIYASDKVHMSRLGYKLWNAWVKIAMDSKTPCIRWANAVCMEKR